MFEKFLEQIYLTGMVPAVALEDSSKAKGLGEALVRGDIPIIEVTLRTDAAIDSIAAMRDIQGLTVGAGTVLHVDQAKRAMDAGATFVVAPGLNPKVVAWCIDNKIPVIPGTATPSEIEQALDFGLDVVKFFPAEAEGGVKTLKALGGPYKNVKFLPTGGINLSNIGEYARTPNVIAVGGTWITPADAIEQGNFSRIEGICKQSNLALHGFELAHVGINCTNTAEAKNVCTQFCNMFGLECADKGGGYFAGSLVDVVKSPLLGANGHIGVNCNNVDRAKVWFERRGYRFVERGSNRDGCGWTSVFFDGEVGGFAIHLRRKEE